MSSISCKSMVQTVKEVFNAPMRKFNGFMLWLSSLMLATQPTLCVKIKGNLDMDTVFGSMADIVIKIAFYVGALIAIGGVFSLVLAYKDDNAEGQTRAVRLIVVGCVLIGFKTILSLAGIITE